MSDRQKAQLKFVNCPDCGKLHMNAYQVKDCPCKKEVKSDLMSSGSTPETRAKLREMCNPPLPRPEESK